MASAHAYQRRISVPVRHLVWIGDVCLSITTTTRPGYVWAIWRIPGAAAESSLPFSCRGECAHADSSPCICCPNMCLGGRADFCTRCVSVIDRAQPCDCTIALCSILSGLHTTDCTAAAGHPYPADPKTASIDRRDASPLRWKPVVSVSPSPQEATARAAASITSSGTVQSQFPVYACEPNILISACQRIDMRAMLGSVAHGV